MQSTTATQTVTINATSGAFNLTFQGATTADLPFNATAAQVQAALNSILPSGGSVGVTATTSIIAGGTNSVYTITFGGTMAASAEPQIVGVSSTVNPLAGGLAGVAPNVDVQLVTVNEPAGSTAGTFAISFNGQTTTSLPYNATPAQVTTALESLPNVGAGTVIVNEAAGGTFTVVEGDPTIALPYNATPASVQAALQTVLNSLLLNTSSHGWRDQQRIYHRLQRCVAWYTDVGIDCNRQQCHARDHPQQQSIRDRIPRATRSATATRSAVRAWRLPAIVAQPANGATTAVLPAGSYSDDIQLLSVNELPGTTSGIYTLSFAGQTTSSLAYNSTAAQVQAALQALPSIGAQQRPGFRLFGALNIVFVGAFAGQGSAIPLIGASGTLGAASPRLGRAGGQLQPGADPEPTTGSAGTFKLSFNGLTTGSLAFNATVAQVQAALQSLQTPGASNFAVRPPERLTWFCRAKASAGPSAPSAVAARRRPFSGLDLQRRCANHQSRGQLRNLHAFVQWPDNRQHFRFRFAATIQSALQTIVGANNVVVSGAPRRISTWYSWARCRPGAKCSDAGRVVRLQRRRVGLPVLPKRAIGDRLRRVRRLL